jgi:hypothetical protein
VSSYPRYYALRRVNPYRGVTMVVDVGEASALSQDGVTWHLRGDDGYGWVRPTGIWVEGEGLKAGAGRQNAELLAALTSLPPLPFPCIDRMELWLLARESRLPLALLASETLNGGVSAPADAHWLPFVRTYTAFHSEALAQAQAGQRTPSAHRDVLASMVNDAARPHPTAQWFRRSRDGGGEGLSGLRVPAELEGRALVSADFPELLVGVVGNNLLEQSVIRDYHAWLSPLLLLLPGLSAATRANLERMACQHPRWLARVHRLLPEVLDTARLQAALVAARIEQASETAQNDPF